MQGEYFMPVLLAVLMFIAMGIFSYLAYRANKRIKKYLPLFKELLRKGSPLDALLPDRLIISTMGVFVMMPRKLLAFIYPRLKVELVPAAARCDLIKYSIYLVIFCMILVLGSIFLKPYFEAGAVHEGVRTYQATLMPWLGLLAYQTYPSSFWQ